MTRAAFGPPVVVALLGVGLVSGCTGQIAGQARPDPAVTVASGPSQSSRSAPTTTTERSSSTRPSLPSSTTSGSRLLVCDQVPAILNSATRSINDYLDVANATDTVTPALVTAESRAIAELAPVPGRLRSLPGLRTLPASDTLAREVPALAASVEAVAAAIPLRKSAPFNEAKDGYNTHLDAIRAQCR